MCMTKFYILSFYFDSLYWAHLMCNRAKCLNFVRPCIEYPCNYISSCTPYTKWENLCVRNNFISFALYISSICRCCGRWIKFTKVNSGLSSMYVDTIIYAKYSIQWSTVSYKKIHTSYNIYCLLLVG